MEWNTFVVRLWTDRPGGRPRGEIVHLQTKETSAFVTWPQAEAFVRRFVPALDDGAAFDSPEESA